MLVGHKSANTMKQPHLILLFYNHKWFFPLITRGVELRRIAQVVAGC